MTQPTRVRLDRWLWAARFFKTRALAAAAVGGGQVEVNGEHASLAWDLHDLHRLQYFDHRDEGRLRGWRSIHVTDHGGGHPYMDKWWVPGLQIGYESSFVHQVADFIGALDSGKPAMPDFRDAYRTQLVLDAILESAREGRWVDVKQA